MQVLDHFGDDHSSSGHLYLVRLLGEDVGISKCCDRADG